jgi:inorganic pyrophosphatase
MHDGGVEDFKILAVEHTDPMLTHYRALGDLSPNLLRQIATFLSTYKDLEGGKTSVDTWQDCAAAVKLIERCREQFVQHHKPAVHRHA